ncbi:MAG: hypothetical protein LBB26_03740 [Puniceicoccales bacterium]|nr:hypothetical protein [Puniceicoccales bacterium]
MVVGLFVGAGTAVVGVIVVLFVPGVFPALLMIGSSLGLGTSGTAALVASAVAVIGTGMGFGGKVIAERVQGSSVSPQSDPQNPPPGTPPAQENPPPGDDQPNGSTPKNPPESPAAGSLQPASGSTENSNAEASASPVAPTGLKFRKAPDGTLMFPGVPGPGGKPTEVFQKIVIPGQEPRRLNSTDLTINGLLSWAILDGCTLMGRVRLEMGLKAFFDPDHALPPANDPNMDVAETLRAAPPDTPGATGTKAPAKSPTPPSPAVPIGKGPAPGPAAGKPPAGWLQKIPKELQEQYKGLTPLTPSQMIQAQGDKGFLGSPARILLASGVTILKTDGSPLKSNDLKDGRVQRGQVYRDVAHAIQAMINPDAIEGNPEEYPPRPVEPSKDSGGTGSAPSATPGKSTPPPPESSKDPIVEALEKNGLTVNSSGNLCFGSIELIDMNGKPIPKSAAENWANCKIPTVKCPREFLIKHKVPKEAICGEDVTKCKFRVPPAPKAIGTGAGKDAVLAAIKGKVSGDIINVKDYVSPIQIYDSVNPDTGAKLLNAKLVNLCDANGMSISAKYFSVDGEIDPKFLDKKTLKLFKICAPGLIAGGTTQIEQLLADPDFMPGTE